MFVYKKILVFWDYFWEGKPSSPAIPPVDYRGFAKDREALAKDQNKVYGDMQRGWEKTKQKHNLVD